VKAKLGRVVGGDSKRSTEYLAVNNSPLLF